MQEPAALPGDIVRFEGGNDTVTVHVDGETCDVMLTLNELEIALTDGSRVMASRSGSKRPKALIS